MPNFVYGLIREYFFDCEHMIWIKKKMWKLSLQWWTLLKQLWKQGLKKFKPVWDLNPKYESDLHSNEHY